MPKLPRGQLASVTPTVLVWARNRVNLDIFTAARQIGIEPPILALWEAGEAFPTVPQLRKLAHVYRRPVAVFFLQEPPVGFSVMEDYRVHRLSESDMISKELAIEISLAQEHRAALLEVADEIDARFENFNITIVLDEHIEASAEKLREKLEISFDDQLKWRSSDKALGFWIAAVERLNVLVFQSSKFDLKEARGFSLFFEVLPIIFLNGKDSPAGKIFTLLHELVHLALIKADSSLVRTFQESTERKKDFDKKTEAYCNMIASETMVPSAQFKSHVITRHIVKNSVDVDLLSSLAKYFSVSRDFVLLRLKNLEYVSNEIYYVLQKALDSAFFEAKAREKEKEGKGPPPYTMALRDLGTTYTRIVLEALGETKVSDSTASGLLRLKTKHFSKLTDALFKKLSLSAT
jgi:Zn-dependent peptidase ImmA (M78 family)